MSAPRVLRTYQGQSELPALLQSLFVAELISPSQRIWLVSPWVTDFVALRNDASRLSELHPGLTDPRPRLSRVLASLVELGSEVRMMLLEDRRNDDFLERLRLHLGTAWEDRVLMRYVPELHEKGLLGDDYFLSGSFNFTHSGVLRNIEQGHFHRGAEVNPARRAFESLWSRSGGGARRG